MRDASDDWCYCVDSLVMSLLRKSLDSVFDFLGVSSMPGAMYSHVNFHDCIGACIAEYSRGI